MAEEADCGIDDSRSRLSYDRSAIELSSCKKSDFTFEIHSVGNGVSRAFFEIRKDGYPVRRNTSKPFPDGALTKKDMSVNNNNCNVQLKKHMSLNLHDYF